MVSKILIRILCMFLLFGCGICFDTSISLTRIKYFEKEALKQISLDGYYECKSVYMIDKKSNNSREISNNCRNILKFRSDGYIETLLASYGGVIYLKKGSLKIDLIGGTQDGCRKIETYSLKIEGNRIYLIEENLIFNEKILCYIYELKL